MKNKIEQEINTAKILLNGLACAESPEEMTVRLDGGKKAIFRLEKVGDGTVHYEFDRFLE